MVESYYIGRISSNFIKIKKGTLYALVSFEAAAFFSAFTARADRRAVKQIFQQT